MEKKNNSADKSSNYISGNDIIKVIGFGNIIMGDDGVGVRVIEKLKEEKELRRLDNVELIDGGTSGVDIIFILKDAARAIIIDAVDAGQKKAEIVKFSPDDIKKIGLKKKGFKSFSLHDIDLNEVFELMKTLKLNVKVKIIGIKPLNVGYSEQLSPEIEEKLPQLVDIVKKEVLN